MRRDIGGIPFLGQILLGELLAGAGTSGSSAGACAAAAFSAWTAAQISSRYTGIDLGAAMPMRTVEPVTSITSMQTSSPTLIFSPARLVMMSIATPPWRTDSGRLGLVVGTGPLEQRRPHRSVGGLVDDLVAVATRDQDRREEVGTEVLQALRGADGDEDRRIAGLRAADSLGVVVGQLDLVVVEEAERIGHRQ